MLRTSSDAPFLGGDLRWPNGPWPGEKTPYFPAKTGHMARHGIWPSDRMCLRWADLATASCVRGRTGSIGPDGPRLGGRGGSNPPLHDPQECAPECWWPSPERIGNG